MSLSPGSELGHYTVVEAIGRGGMGEVYRARDGKLGRDVAIKVLPGGFAEDDGRLKRFEREAKVLASLNHSNIASIYGLEQSGTTHYIVQELVPGETLADRIARGPLSLDDALAIADQIANALEEAHRHGIVHRDLKPANVKVTPDDRVKVLDFGLAKAFVDETSEASSSMSPTLTRDATRAGVILGTAAYMSPEQAKGKPVDRRADIWAFGVVLYEMLTGRRAFEGEDVSDTLAAVMRAEPEWEKLPRHTAGAMRRVLELCIAKNPEHRMRDIGDVRLALAGAFDTAEGTATIDLRRGLGLAVLSALAGAAAGIAFWSMLGAEPPSSPQPVARFELRTELMGEPQSAQKLTALSADGTRIVYRANDQLYVRELDALHSVAIRGTEGAAEPFLSPNGEWVGYRASGELRKVPIGGGASVRLCSAPIAADPRWEADGRIVFVNTDGIATVSENGGTPELLVEFDTIGGQVVHGAQLLPGGRDLLFAMKRGANWDDAQIVVQSLGSTERRLLIDRGRAPRYVPTGHLIYAVEGSLFAVRFDAERARIESGPVPLVQGVGNVLSGQGDVQYSVSDDGSLLYLPDNFARALVWVDRDGNEEPIGAEPRAYRYPRISPDGGRVALDVRGGEENVWVWDFAAETLTRFTVGTATNVRPAWTRDSRSIVFYSNTEGRPSIYRKNADGTGPTEKLVEGNLFPTVFANDGVLLALHLPGDGGGAGVNRIERGGEVERLALSDFTALNAALSPDNRWLAYQSNETGQFEIYVRRYPIEEGGKQQVTNGGGQMPLWSPVGNELFYVRPSGELMSVPVRTEPSFTSDRPEVVYAGSFYRGSLGRTYDIVPDGKRFLMIKANDATGDTSRLILVQNWLEEVKRLLPSDGD